MPLPGDPMNEVAQELRAMPKVVAALLATHVPDEQGKCRACTKPGTGIPFEPWPCALHFYASAARTPDRLA